MSSPIVACRSCGKPVMWLKHEVSGANAPIDAKPHERGSCVVDLKTGTYRVVKSPYEGEAYIPHFATCPDANVWRKKRA